MLMMLMVVVITCTKGGIFVCFCSKRQRSGRLTTAATALFLGTWRHLILRAGYILYDTGKISAVGFREATYSRPGNTYLRWVLIPRRSSVNRIKYVCFEKDELQGQINAYVEP